MKKEVTLTENTQFVFPEHIVVKKMLGKFLVYSVDTANWIVLQSSEQLRLLDDLRMGKTVGEIMEIAENENCYDAAAKLLSSLLAREFVSQDGGVVPIKLDRFNHLYIYMTNACNLRCKHCFMNSGIKMKDELTTEEIKKLLSDFKGHSGVAITFTGGEPTVRSDFGILLYYAHSIGLSTTVLTNGTTWTEQKIKELAPYITEVQISLDGIDEETNSKVRGKGFFETTVSNIIAFANCGIQTSVATTLTFDNLTEHTKEDFKALIDRIDKATNGGVLFRLSKKILQGRGVHYSDEDNKCFYEQICEIEDYVYPHARLNNFIEGHTPNLVSTNCGYGGLSIAANGDVFVCNRISEVDKIGNVRNNSIDSLLAEGKKLFEITSVERVAPCKDCYLRNICGGGCRIDDFNFKGRIKNADDEIRQIKCSGEYKLSLERLMIECFEHNYKF